MPSTVPTQPGTALPKPPLGKIYAIQFAGLLAGITGLWAAGAAFTTVYSALFGGMIAVLANAIFAFRVFRYRGAQATRQIANALYRGEASKFTLTAVLFGGLFAGVKPLNGMAVFTAFLLLTCANWACAWQLTQRRQ